MEIAAQRKLVRPATFRARRVFLWILIFLAATEFMVRGPMRYLRERTNWNDLSQNYTASKLWLKGRSPADPRNFIALWFEEGRSRLELTDIRTHLAPPLGGLVVLAPVAALPWKAAKVAWLAILLVSVALTVRVLALTAGFRLEEDRTLAFIAACLALAPFQTGFATGNTSILVIGLCAVAIWAARKDADLGAGILFGIACSVKPQLGAFLVLYYLVRRRWRLFAISVATTVALNVIAVLYLQLRGAPWVHDYLSNARGFVAANHIDDFSAQNPIRFTLINLQVPFFAITDRSSSANLLAFGVVALLVSVWIYLIVRKKYAAELLCLGAISVIALLPVYHRFYDAGILAVPISWCIANATTAPSKKVARIALILMLPFLIPGTAFLQQLAVHGHISQAVTHSRLWNVVVMSHETWTLLFLSLVLLYGINWKAPEAQSHF